ncbi:MAG: ParB/RepB/Spo0J family partition protein [Elusimicrobiaceae bacterium]|nr:ParB/RepB/Spo0J family partition protein [Elusimicrobiaceae bacterium]
MRQALGKGLDALIKRTGDVSGRDSAAVKKIPVNKIKPNRFQPRRVFSDESLAELAQSIKQHGLAQPIITAYNAQEKCYELIAGERRWRACQLAAMTEIDAIVHEAMPDEQMLGLALVENIQREDLNPIDTAMAYRELVSKFNVPQGELARYCGKAKSTISNTLRLLELDADIQRSIQTGLITEGHARALLTVPDKEDRKRLFQLVVERKMTVRDAETAARGTGEREKTARPRRHVPPEVAAFEGKLRERLGTRVELKQGRKGKGALVIHYHSLEDLERIAGLLAAN